MKKLELKDYIALLILSLFFFWMVAMLTGKTYLYGSLTDWQDQYWEFSEYFRNLFYHTHDLFPNLALNIGAGQNIYNFSYYGLFNPIIMFSYLLPFIPMMDYIIISSIGVVIGSLFLFYLLLKNNGASFLTCIGASFLFLCAGPLIFQSHRQIMFINYIPFLLAALLGVNLYRETNKSWLLILGVFLMILTSYYYSVGGIMAIGVYSIYDYLKQKRAGQFFSYLWSIIIRTTLGIVMSSILLVPTFLALLNGRSSGGKESLLDISLLIPSLNLQDILYQPYSFGVTSIAVLALIGNLIWYKKRENCFLSVIFIMIMSLPAVNFILNGTLYLDAKVFIPFIPLLCLNTAMFIENLVSRHRNEKRIPIFLLLITLITLTSVLLIRNSSGWQYRSILCMDLIVTITSVIFAFWSRRKTMILIPLAVVAAFSCITFNMEDHLMPESSEDRDFSKKNIALIDSVLENDDGFYRFSNNSFPLINSNKVYGSNYYMTTEYSSVYNQNYYKTYFHVFQNEMSFRNALIMNPTKNILFDLFMGNKYLVTAGQPPIGYRKYRTDGTLTIYKNSRVLPIGYVNSRLITQNEFDKLSYPYNVEALLQYSVVKDKVGEKGYKYTTAEQVQKDSGIQKVIPEQMISNVAVRHLTLEERLGRYMIHARKNGEINISLNQEVKDKIILLRAHLYRRKGSSGDLKISVNGIVNKLTSDNSKYKNENYDFDYVISSNNDIKKLNLKFSPGIYEIGNIEVYTMDYAGVSKLSSAVDAFNSDPSKTAGDQIQGTVKADKNGYFVLSVPYDNGFQVWLDGKKTAYEKVNTSFIGFPVEQGKHQIRITYRAPGQLAGLAGSMLGLFVLILVFMNEYCIIDRLKYKKRSDRTLEEQKSSP